MAKVCEAEELSVTVYGRRTLPCHRDAKMEVRGFHVCYQCYEKLGPLSQIVKTDDDGWTKGMRNAWIGIALFFLFLVFLVAHMVLRGN